MAMVALPHDDLEPNGDFEGKQILRSAVEIPGAAGGLQEALKIDPVEWSHGERVYLLMELHVVKVRFDEVKDTDGLARVHVLKPVADMTMVVDEAFAKAHLTKQAERVRRAREEAAGILSFPPTGPDITAPTDPHESYEAWNGEGTDPADLLEDEDEYEEDGDDDGPVLGGTGEE